MKKANLMWAFTGVVVVLNAAVYLFRPGGDLLLTVASDFLPAGSALAAVIALTATFRALKVFDQTKAAWLLLLVGIGLFFIAETAYGFQEVFLKVDMDELYPSIADLFWLLGYIPVFTGLAILLLGYLQAGLPAGNLARFLAAGAVILGLGVFLIFRLFVPILADDTLTPLVRFFYLFYPLADLILLVPAGILILITTYFGRSLLARPWMYIAAGFALMGIADISYSFLDWQGLYGPGHPIDIAWNASYCVIGLAGYSQARLVRSL